MADGEIISYVKLGEYAEKLKADIDKMDEYALEVRRIGSLVGKTEDEGVWAGPAAHAFSVAFQNRFAELYSVVRAMARWQKKLEKASQAYAMADKQVTQVADRIEQAVWAEV